MVLDQPIDVVRHHLAHFAAPHANGLGIEPDESWPWEITDPREAWEVLLTRGLVSEDPRRGFAGRERAPIGVAIRAPDDDGAIPVQLSSGFTTDAAGSRQPVMTMSAGTLVLRAGAPIRKGEPVAYNVAGEVEPLRAVLEHPATVAEAVALASDWAGVVTAEAIAREACGPSKDVVWRVVAADEHERLARRMCEYGGVPPASTVRWTGAVLALGYAVADFDRARIVLAAPAL